MRSSRSENISLNLRFTNGTCRVQGPMKDTVDRVTGSVVAFSFMWTNVCPIFDEL